MGNSQDFRFLTFNGYVSQNLRVATFRDICYPLLIRGSCRKITLKTIRRNMAYCSSIGHEFLAFLNRTWRPSTALEAGFSCDLTLADRLNTSIAIIRMIGFDAFNGLFQLRPLSSLI